MPSTPQIVSKTSANKSSEISTAWVAVRMSSYLLGTNKGSGERLTLVSVLWTSSLKQRMSETWKIGQKRSKTGAPGKIRSCCILPGLTRSTKLTPPGGNTGN